MDSFLRQVLYLNSTYNVGPTMYVWISRASDSVLGIFSEKMLLDFDLSIHPKGDQSCMFTGQTDAEAETPILWPPHAKS